MSETIDNADSAILEEIKKILDDGVSNRNAHVLAVLVIAYKLGKQVNEY